jgi:hypothetical protein
MTQYYGIYSMSLGVSAGIYRDFLLDERPSRGVFVITL